MKTTKFEEGQPVRAKDNAQGLRKGALYRVLAVDERTTFVGNFVRYQVRAEVGGEALWVVNGHLLLAEVDTSTSDAILGLWSESGGSVVKATSRKVARPAPLPPAELILAAKYFTVSNLGQEPPGGMLTVKAVERAYYEVQAGCEAEGIDIGDEYRSWIREFTKRDPHFMAEWAKDAARITDIETVRAPAPRYEVRYRVLGEGWSKAKAMTLDELERLMKRLRAKYGAGGFEVTRTEKAVG